MPEFTNSDGLSIFYETHGFDNTGPVVVFLNGMTQTTRNWATHCRELKDDYRIVTYDARGQGQTDDPDEPPTITEHARDLHQLLDELDVDRPHLVGFSHGARVALGFAAHYPDRLGRLVLCSVTAEPTALARTIVRSWREVLDEGGVRALSWAAIPAILGNEFLEDNAFMLDNIIRASTDRNSEEGTRLLLEGLEDYPPLKEPAGDVEAPTLVVSASEDPLVDAEGARELAELCGGDHILVEGCGHTIPIERPDQFRETITDFLF